MALGFYFFLSWRRSFAGKEFIPYPASDTYENWHKQNDGNNTKERKSIEVMPPYRYE
jgi:hypothetical protein